MLSLDGYKIETDSIDEKTLIVNPASPVSFKANEDDDFDVISKLGDRDVSWRSCSVLTRINSIGRVDFSVY